MSISTEVNIPRHTGLVTATSPIPTAAGVCCAPLVRAPLSAEDAVAVTATLKAIADPARLRLLSLVAAHEGGEACVCDLIEPLGLSQPTVSHHLKKLTEAGLLEREQRGRWAYFSLRPDAVETLAAVVDLKGAWCS